MSTGTWKNLFSKKILDRGFEYFKDGLVSNLQIDGDSILADVEGSELYEVEILLRNNDIGEMFCSCPYAEDGDYCKHMAAVLFQWENDREDHSASKEPADSQSFEKIINDLPEKVVRDLLLELVSKDKMLQKNILIYQSGTVTKKQKKEWSRELYAIQKRYCSYSGYVNYDRACEYFREIIDFLDRSIAPLINTGLWNDALDLIDQTYDIACDVEYDCDDDCFGEFIGECEYYIRVILTNFDIFGMRDVYKKFLSFCDGKISPHNNSFWQDCLLDLFDEDEFVRNNLQLIDTALQNTSKSKDNRWLVTLIEKRIDFMQKLGYTDEQISAFRSEYEFLPAIRKMMIRDALEAGRDIEAIELLKESKRIDIDDRLLQLRYSEKLIQLYEHQNMVDDCRTELLSYISENPQCDLTYIQKLKQYMSDNEWGTFFADYLSCEKNMSRRHALMAEEKMYRKLLDELETDPSLYELLKYESLLKPIYPEELRDVLFEYLQRQMYFAHDRSTYADLIKRLKKMTAYPGGSEMTAAIANEWKTTYRRRSALLEELKHAGF